MSGIQVYEAGMFETIKVFDSFGKEGFIPVLPQGLHQGMRNP